MVNVLRKLPFVLLSLLVVPVLATQIGNHGSFAGSGFTLVCSNYQSSVQTAIVGHPYGSGGYVGVPTLFVANLNFTIANISNVTSPEFYFFVLATESQYVVVGQSPILVEPIEPNGTALISLTGYSARSYPLLVAQMVNSTVTFEFGAVTVLKG